MIWRYVEPCCGSASTALALVGARKPLLPYQGSKWRFRKTLLGLFTDLGFGHLPERVLLGDPGPWGTVAPTVFQSKLRVGVLDQLRMMNRLDARVVYDALHRQPLPEDPVVYSAQFLFLQRLAYSGKAVGERAGRWVSPGFNSSSAFGIAGTDRFGKVNPMIPSLIRVLEGYAELQSPPVDGHRLAARAPANEVAKPTLVYIDPPYAGSTGYPGGELARAGVVRLARGWRDAGAAVVVSEAECISELVAEGWRKTCMTTGRNDTSRFRGKQQEWLTYVGPATR